MSADTEISKLAASLAATLREHYLITGGSRPPSGGPSSATTAIVRAYIAKLLETIPEEDCRAHPTPSGGLCLEFGPQRVRRLQKPKYGMRKLESSRLVRGYKVTLPGLTIQTRNT